MTGAAAIWIDRPQLLPRDRRLEFLDCGLDIRKRIEANPRQAARDNRNCTGVNPTPLDFTIVGLLVLRQRAGGGRLA
jgi:hypothetical protein